MASMGPGPGFEGQTWRDRIHDRDFIGSNYAPSLGGPDFVCGQTVGTKGMEAHLRVDDLGGLGSPGRALQAGLDAVS